MAKRFTGKTILVTGAAGGLGRGFALGFAREGASQLILLDVNMAGLEETAQLAKAEGAQSSLHKADLTSDAEVQAFAAEVSSKFSEIHVLMNNAGLAYGEINQMNDTVTYAQWLKFFSVNTIAPMVLAQGVRASLKKAQGNVINISSMASYVPATPYGVTKAALNAMNYGMGQVFGSDGIRVNAIAPGIMATPNSVAGVSEDNYKRIQQMQVLKQLRGETEDIVNLALFLASDDARFITCEIVHCDAGNGLRGWR